MFYLLTQFTPPYMLNVIVPSVVMMAVIMLSVVLLSVILLSVVDGRLMLLLTIVTLSEKIQCQTLQLILFKSQ
jgi:hypothetical protein